MPENAKTKLAGMDGVLVSGTPEDYELSKRD
jgi:hypothetical protein